MAEQVKTLRPFRFWRWPAKSGAALLLVLGVTVYGARLPDQFACLQLITGYSGNLSFGIVDLNAGISVADPRTSRQPGGIPSPDGKFAAFIQPEKQGASESKLVVQGTDAPTGTWVLQN